MSNSKMWKEPFEEVNVDDEPSRIDSVSLSREQYHFTRGSYNRSRYVSRGYGQGRYNPESYVRGNRNDHDGSWRTDSGQDNYASVAKQETETDREQTDGSREPYVSSDAATTFRPGNGGNFNKLDDVPVRVCGRNPPASLGYTFLRAGLRKDVLVNMRKAKYTWPTPIQRYAIPIVLAGRDLLVCAQTGSGKKAAFVLPLINRLLSLKIRMKDESAPNPYILIVAPMQDIAHQIYAVARKFIRGTPLRLRVICGGASMGYQQRSLDQGCDVLVATLGRLHQFLSCGSISLRNVRYLVLHEVDRILNMGFQPAIDKLLSVEQMPPNKARQTLMSCASFSRNVQELATKLLHDNISVFVSVVGSAAADIEQIIYEVEQLRKPTMLEEILREGDPSGTLIFVKMKRNVDWLATEMEKQHFTTVSIHGDRPYHEREEAISDFRNGRKDVLIATSVIACDLDFRSVRHVINYDMPRTIGEYVQRIGLTGRVGSKGRATSFYDPHVDHCKATYLMQVLNETGQAVPNFLDAATNMHAGRRGAFCQPESLFGGVDDRADEEPIQEDEQ